MTPVICAFYNKSKIKHIVKQITSQTNRLYLWALEDKPSKDTEPYIQGRGMRPMYEAWDSLLDLCNDASEAVCLVDDLELPDNWLTDFTTASQYIKADMAGAAITEDSETQQPFMVKRPELSFRRVNWVGVYAIYFSRYALDRLRPFGPQAQPGGWGMDMKLAQQCDNYGLSQYVVDAYPVKHTRPVADLYDKSLALKEHNRWMLEHNIKSRQPIALDRYHNPIIPRVREKGDINHGKD